MTRFVLVALALLASTACGGASKHIRPTSDMTVDRSAAQVARGEYLVNGIAACGACHNGHADNDLLSPHVTSLLGGGAVLEEGDKIRLYVPNVTPDRETGLGDWTDDEILRAIRDGIRKDGTVLFPIMPYGAYAHVSDEDAHAIVAYLRSIPPAKPSSERIPVEAPGMLRMLVKKGVTLHEPAMNVPQPNREDPVAYGSYLAQLGHCGECHSATARGPRSPDHPEYMAGSSIPFVTQVGTVWAPNLTGLDRYTPDQIATALTEGTRFDGEVMMPPMSHFPPYLASLLPEDMAALVAYLRALPAVTHQVPPRQVTPFGAQWLADAEAQREARATAATAATPPPASDAPAEAQGSPEGGGSDDPAPTPE